MEIGKIHVATNLPSPRKKNIQTWQEEPLPRYRGIEKAAQRPGSSKKRCIFLFSKNIPNFTHKSLSFSALFLQIVKTYKIQKYTYNNLVNPVLIPLKRVY